jgi:hypothetical protein
VLSFIACLPCRTTAEHFKLINGIRLKVPCKMKNVLSDILSELFFFVCSRRLLSPVFRPHPVVGYFGRIYSYLHTVLCVVGCCFLSFLKPIPAVGKLISSQFSESRRVKLKSQFCSKCPGSGFLTLIKSRFHREKMFGMLLLCFTCSFPVAMFIWLSNHALLPFCCSKLINLFLIRAYVKVTKKTEVLITS